MADATSPTQQRPKYHATLTIGANTLGFLLVDGDGNVVRLGKNAYPIRRTPVERQAIKTFSGASDYDSYNWPYMTATQRDWTGGRGSETFEDDRSKYFDGWGVDTSKENRVILGGHIYYGKNYRNQNDNTRTSLRWRTLNSTNGTYLAGYITVTANYSADYAEVWLRKRGSPTGNVTVRLHSDNSGEPGTVLKTVTLDVPTYLTDTLGAFVKADWATTQAVTSAAATYWLSVSYTGSTATDYVQVGTRYTVGGLFGFSSSDGSTWTVNDYDPQFIVRDNSDTVYPSKVVFINDYKGLSYFVTQPDDGTDSYLYINGWRGAADSNTANKDRLVDAATNFTTYLSTTGGDLRVIITKGPGSEERQNWRKVTSVNNGYLEVSPNWIIDHTTATEYVVTGSLEWNQLLDLDGYCTDACVAGNNIYFAFGDDSGNDVVKRYEAYNAAGTWTTRTLAEESIRARNITSIIDAAGNAYLYGTQHANTPYGHCIWRAKVPIAWGALYQDIGEVVGTDGPWIGQLPPANVTMTMNGQWLRVIPAAGFTTGEMCRIPTLATPVDITGGSAFGFLAYSTVDLNANDVTIEYAADASFTNSTTINVPAMTASTWSWISISLDTVSSTVPAAAANYTALDNVRINMAVDKGAMSFYVGGGIRLISASPEYFNMPDSFRINRLITYQDEDNTQPAVWAITTNGVYSFGGTGFQRLPLDEIASLPGTNNGTAACVNDVYLTFNLGNKVERYYSNTLEDIGPDREGLPEDRVGEPSFLISQPGSLILGIDGGTRNYSSILRRVGNAWYELYRSPRVGERIRSGFVQTIVGQDTNHLWFVMGGSLAYIPLSLNAYKDPDYAYTHEGYVETGWIYANLHGLTKIVKTLFVFSENSTGSGTTIEVDYKTDDDAAWTPVTEEFLSSIEKNDIASTPITCNRIKLRFRLMTTSYLVSPALEAWGLDMIGVNEVKNSYEFTAILADEGAQELTTLDEDEDIPLGISTSITAALGYMDSAVTNGTPCTFNTIFDPMNAATVKLEPYAIQPIYTKASTGDAQGMIEKHLLHILLNEI